MQDIDVVIKALRMCTRPVTRECSLKHGVCPYEHNGCRTHMEADALELLIRFKRLFGKEDDPEEAMNQMERHEGMIL